MAITSDRPNVRVRFDAETQNELERIARENDRTLPQEIRRAVRLYLERQETK